MKIAAPFTLNYKFKELPDEYNITVKKETDPRIFIEFCKLYPEKRLNVYFEDEVLIDILKEGIILNPQIYVRLNIDQGEYLEELLDAGIAYFFNKDYTCYSFTTLESLLELGVSDIYIGDMLCYNMRKVREICDYAGVQIRYILNEIPILTLTPGISIKDPIFSPRDYEALDQYIDVAEFNCGSPYDWDYFDVCYTAWFEKQDFFGDLQLINSDLEFDYIVRYSSNNMNKYKMNCGHSCSFYLCNHCENNYTFMKNLEEENIWIPKGKSMESEPDYF